MSLYAAQTAYYILFSSIPFLMLVLMLVQAIFPRQTDSAIKLITDSFPELFSKLPDDFFDSILSADVPIISVTVVGMLWSASKGVKSLRIGLCSVYGKKDGANWAWRHVASFLYTLFFISLAVLVLGITLWINVICSNVDSLHPRLYTLFRCVIGLRGIVLPFMISCLVALIYKVGAAKEDKFRQLIPGALFTGGVWMIYSWGFSLYIRSFSKYSILYGSIGIIPIVMLWVYSCIVILLLGAEFNVYIKSRRFLK